MDTRGAVHQASEDVSAVVIRSQDKGVFNILFVIIDNAAFAGL